VDGSVDFRRRGRPALSYSRPFRLTYGPTPRYCEPRHWHKKDSVPSPDAHANASLIWVQVVPTSTLPNSGFQAPAATLADPQNIARSSSTRALVPHRSSAQHLRHFEPESRHDKNQRRYLR